MHRALEQVGHRPWPLPQRPWTWRQSWRDLLFAHWPVPAQQLRALVHPQLEVQEFEGTSWIGVVPFHMRGVMRRPFPDLPWISAFPELNLRLYVVAEGKPGVWFLSLDAGNPLAVWAARRFFHLPYFHARMSISGLPERVRYRSFRLSRPRGVEFIAEYEPLSEPYRAEPGSLEHWLTERYCLYTQSSRGQLLRAEVHHHPWPLQRAEASIERNDLFRPHGLAASGPPALLHFSRRLDVVLWPPCGVEAAFPGTKLEGAIDPSTNLPGGHAPTWEVWRQDDNGKRFQVQAGLSEARARQLVDELESRGHKQAYWAQRVRPGTGE